MKYLKRPIIGIPLLIALILYISLNVWVFVYARAIAGKPDDNFTQVGKTSIKTLGSLSGFSAKPTPPPIPIPRPLAHGKQVYGVSGGTKGAPQMSEFVIDPVDPEKGGSQSISIQAKDPEGIKTITVALWTDKGGQSYTLDRVEGTDTNGRWQKSWTNESTFQYRYHANVKAQNTKNKTSMMTVTLR